MCFSYRSDSPTGPFTVQTNNKGLTIDGHVFIDDDGQWYFYRAEHWSDHGTPNDDPYTFGPAIPTGASMGGSDRRSDGDKEKWKILYDLYGQPCS